MFPKIINTIEKLQRTSIPENRLKILNKFSDLIAKENKKIQFLNLNFICTHNSRRSHLAQVWAQTLAIHFGLKIQCYSGGTEATAVYPMVINTLKLQGFQIGKLDRPDNPLYYLKYDKNAQPVLLFSKAYNHEFNPQTDFTAVMTCSDADENCPIVSGAKHRFALTYEDPKAFDGTELAEKKYIDRSLQIAAELCFVFKRIASN